jgi:hypothetical protein
MAEALRAAEEAQPDGLIERPAGYTLDLEGHVMVAELGARVNCNFNLALDRFQAWRELTLRLKLRPDVYEVHAAAAEETVRIRADTGDSHYDHTFTYADLRNPQKLLREAGGPMLPAVLASLGLPLSTNAAPRLALGLTWRARLDWLLAGRTRMRVYRLETRLLDLYQARVYVSPVGEILRVELPGEILFLHDTLNNLPPAP